MEDGEIIINWVDAIERIPATSFIRVNSFDGVPEPAHTESVYWTEHFFKPKTNPHFPDMHTNFSYVCDTTYIDLVKHQYIIQSNDTVSIFEGRNFFIVRFTLLHDSPTDSIKLIQHKADEVLKTKGEDYHWSFNSSNKFFSETIFTTNKEINFLGLRNWKSKINGLIRSGHIYIIGYKKVESIVGFLNDYQWFPDEIRKK